MREPQSCVKLLPVREGGFVACPECIRRKAENAHWQPNRALIRIGPKTTARGLLVKCRCCKSEFVLNIDEGLRCYEA